MQRPLVTFSVVTRPKKHVLLLRVSSLSACQPIGFGTHFSIECQAVHMESVAEVQQEWGAMNNCSRYIPLYIQDEHRQTLFAEHRMCKHHLRFFEESPAASPQHSTTPTVTQAHCSVNSPKSLRCIFERCILQMFSHQSGTG